MRAVVVVVFLAACGGKASPAPAKDPEEAEFERDLAEAKAFADRTCACADRACTDAIDKEMAEEFRTTDLDTSSSMSPEQEQQVENEVVRILECLTAKGTVPYSLGVLSVRVFDSIRADICACQDTNCARSAIAAWDEAYQGVGKYPADDATKKDFEQRIVPEATACFQKGHALITEEAVIELKAIRKGACACVDADCATANRAEFDAWLVTHEKTGADQTTQEEIAEVAREMALCQAAASQEAAKQAILDLTALRDAACACTTAECADDVQTAFDAFLVKYADHRSSPAESELVGTLAGEMSACLETARGKAPAAK